MCWLCLPGKTKKKEKEKNYLLWHLLVSEDTCPDAQPRGRDGEPAGRDLGHCRGWGSAGSEPSRSSGAHSLLSWSLYSCPLHAHARVPLWPAWYSFFTRCLGADSPEPWADIEVEKPTTCDTEPSLQLKQKNHSPQIHNRLVSQTQGFVSSLVFFRSLLLLLPASVMWLLL